jgi:hypothetical protein
MSRKILFYDCEIINPIRQKSDWRNYAYLGISVIGAYANWLPRKRRLQAFTEGRFGEFQKLADEADEIVGFNSISFDDPLCHAHGIKIRTTYDLMCEVRRAAGEPISGSCTPGYNLARLSQVNLGRTKTGHGSACPDLWRGGERQKVIDYCLNDVMLLVDLYQLRTQIIDPINPDQTLHCDPRLINWEKKFEEWQEVLGERVISFQVTPYLVSWCDATIARLDIKIADALLIGIPLFVYPKYDFKRYVGLPFNSSVFERDRLALEDDPDIILF